MNTFGYPGFLWLAQLGSVTRYLCHNFLFESVKTEPRIITFTINFLNKPKLSCSVILSYLSNQTMFELLVSTKNQSASIWKSRLAPRPQIQTWDSKHTAADDLSWEMIQEWHRHILDNHHSKLSLHSPIQSPNTMKAWGSTSSKSSWQQSPPSFPSSKQYPPDRKQQISTTSTTQLLRSHQYTSIANSQARYCRYPQPPLT